MRDMVAEVVENVVRLHLAESDYAEDWDLDAVVAGLRVAYDCRLSAKAIDTAGKAVADIIELAVDDALTQYDERERILSPEQMRSVERAIMLQVIDGRWKDHLLDMDYKQEGIHLRAQGQKDPLIEYKNEAFDLFQDMLESIKLNTVTTLLKNRPEDLAIFTAITLEQPLGAMNYTSGEDLANETSFAAAAQSAGQPTVFEAGSAGPAGSAAPASAGGVAVQQRVVDEKVGRNDPCPCGSGKKYKRCHGA